MKQALETRLEELKCILVSLNPQTASQPAQSWDYVQMQTYIMGFNEALRIIEQSYVEGLPFK